MDSMTIKLIDAKWFLNNKSFEELNPNELQCLDNFFSNVKNKLEKANRSLKNLKSHNYKFETNENN
jgi:hypothetical protein